jgi:hypothetical protein
VTARHKTFLEAALEVLTRHHTPLRATEIVEKAIRLGLLRTRGKTPERTMSARLYGELAENPRTRLRRIAEPGLLRAVRNSVRWTLRT